MCQSSRGGAVVGFYRSIFIVCCFPFYTGTYLDAPKGGAAFLCVKPVGALRYSEFALCYPIRFVCRGGVREGGWRLVRKLLIFFISLFPIVHYLNVIGLRMFMAIPSSIVTVVR